MQVPAVDEAPATLLLVDLVDLQMQPARADEADGKQPGPSAMHLLSDEAAPERLFVRTQSAAWTITLSWLPALANFLAEGMQLWQSSHSGDYFYVLAFYQNQYVLCQLMEEQEWWESSRGAFVMEAHSLPVCYVSTRRT